MSDENENQRAKDGKGKDGADAPERKRPERRIRTRIIPARKQEVVVEQEEAIVAKPRVEAPDEQRIPPQAPKPSPPTAHPNDPAAEADTFQAWTPDGVDEAEPADGAPAAEKAEREGPGDAEAATDGQGKQEDWFTFLPGAEAPPQAPKPAAEEGAAPLEALKDEKSAESRAFLKAIKRQERLRVEQERAEAKRLQDEAKVLLKRAEERGKMQERVSHHQEWVGEMADKLGYDPERPITVIPELAAGRDLVDFREIVPKRAYLRTIFDTKNNLHLHEVVEPQLSKTEDDIYRFMRDTLVRTLPGRELGETPEAGEKVLREALQEAIVDHSILIDEVGTARIQYHLIRDFLGFGPIDVIMSDPMLEDISCDGPGIPVFVFHRQHGSMRTNVVFKDSDELDAFVIRLAQRSGKHISVADPLLDATLPDGSRLQATLAREVTTRGSSFTIRKFRTDPFTPPDLIQFGTWDTRMGAYFWLMVEHGASLILAGGTASGKTSSLNAVCQFIPPERKIVSIEDTREINLRHDNWIAGVTRVGFGGSSQDGGGAAIGMYRLLEAALRQRPEYLLVGEVRGKEALTLFQAMATGHSVYSTMHADSVASAVYRLENEPINVPRLMLQTLDVFAIQGLTHEEGKNVRRILEVTEMKGFDPETGDLMTNTVFRWDPESGTYFYTGRSLMMEEYRVARRMAPVELQREWANRRKVLDWLGRSSIRDFRDVNKVITRYYQRPDEVLAEIEADPKAAADRILAEHAAEDAEAAQAAARARGEIEDEEDE